MRRMFYHLWSSRVSMCISFSLRFYPLFSRISIHHPLARDGVTKHETSRNAREVHSPRYQMLRLLSNVYIKVVSIPCTLATSTPAHENQHHIYFAPRSSIQSTLNNNLEQQTRWLPERRQQCHQTTTVSSPSAQDQQVYTRRPPSHGEHSSAASTASPPS